MSNKKILPNYSELKDADLVLLAKEGDEIAFTTLLKRLNNTIDHVAKFHYANGRFKTLSIDDLCAEGVNSVFYAVKRFDPTKGSFFPFWRSIYSLKLELLAVSEYHYYYPNKNEPSASFDAPTYEGDGLALSERFGFIDSNIKNFTPEDICREMLFSGILTPREFKLAIQLFVEGKKVTEIEAYNRISHDYALKIIRKIKKLYRQTISK